MPRRYLAPTAAVAAITHTPPSTIRTWAMRGYIRQYGTPRNRLYDVEEVQEHAKTRTQVDKPPDQQQH